MCSPASESCGVHKKMYGSSRTGSYGLIVSLSDVLELAIASY